MLRLELARLPVLLTTFNPGNTAITFNWPALEGARGLHGHGLPGTESGSTMTLPVSGGWFGKADG
ncbi:MAG: hypothetical protein ACI9ZF_000619 [Bradyrhizobium sp.]|jgi:hypothetical protein